MVDLPTGTVTFLFTDIEGSTRLWEQHPQAMQTALACHDALLRQTIEAHGGRVFKTMGDQFCAAFSTAPEAVVAALAVQRAVQAEPWPAGVPLQVRVALHAGAVEQRDGDYYGLALSRVARLLEAGHGGQILLSQAGAELLRDRLPAGTSLRDLGKHCLKGLEQPEHIHQLVAPDLPADFPPLRVPEVGRHYLPTPRTPLIGRDQEVAALCDLLRSEDAALITLTGPGGTGKTRLSQAVAAEMLACFAHGVCWVDLAPIRDPGLVLATIAQRLGVREEGGRALQESLQEYLRTKQMLLVLDNFEQVLAAAPAIAELLAAAPGLKILVTSRSVLRLRSEKEFSVPPLALPDLKRLPTAECLGQYAAVALFIQRARDARPEFAVTNENAPAVAEICHRLDGLPLAIELAAARVRLLSPQALLARLESRLKLLTGGARDLPARQQTLRDTIAWSYDLLSDVEQALFRRLAVFLGGCSLEAAEAVSNIDGQPPLPVLDAVAALVEQSLLRQSEPKGRTAGGGELRLVMLETIREFGLEQLAQRGELEATQRQHARYFLQFAAEFAPAVLTPAWAEAMDRMEVEHDNLRAALLWCHHEPTAGDMEQRLVAALESFFNDRGYWREKEQWVQAALARAGLGQPGAAAVRLGSLLSGATSEPSLVNSAADRERLATWAKLLGAAGRREESIAIWRHLGDKRWLAWSLVGGEEAVSLFREIGDQWGLIYALNLLGHTAMDDNDYARARSLFQESLALARELGEPYALSRPLRGLGRLARQLGDYEAARSFYTESTALRRQADDGWLSLGLNDLGEVACELGDLTTAGQAFEEALAIGRERGQPAVVLSLALCGLGRIAWQHGQLEQARTRAEESRRIAEIEGNRTETARALLLLGYVAQAEGDSETAQRLLRQSLNLCLELGQHREVAGRLEALAAVERTRDHLVRAVRLFGAAAALRDVYHLPVPPIDQAHREHQMADLRAILGEEGFTEAWAEGRAMKLEEAVACALEDV